MDMRRYADSSLGTEAAAFRALGDSTRLRLAVLLAIGGEMCVCQLAEALGEPEFKISRHLAVLRTTRWVTARREGTWMHYRLANAGNDLQKRLQECLRNGFRHHATIAGELRRAARAACPGNGKRPRTTAIRTRSDV